MSDEPYKFDQALSADEFLNAPDTVIERVETPELKPGSFVYVRSITAEERGIIESQGALFKEKLQRGKEDPFARDYTVKFAYLCMCNADGTRMFTDIKAVAALKKKNSAVIGRIAARGQKLSGFSKEDIEELEKNSPQTQLEDSLSD